MIKEVNTLVIGAGQAGLATAYYLQQSQRDFVVWERCARVGEQWRARFDGLTLFTPNSLNKLPGGQKPQSVGRFQTKDEFADYLETYAKTQGFPIAFNQDVLKISNRKDGKLDVKSDTQHLIVKHIVLASGAFKDVVVPSITVPESIEQYTVNQLQGKKIQGQRVLVVGDGATGRQLAKILASNNSVTLAQGKSRHLIRESFLGLNTFYLLKMLGLLRLPKRFALAKWLKSRDPFPDTGINNTALDKAGISRVSRLIDLANGARFRDGSQVEVDLIIWATGYLNCYDFIEVPELLNKRGEINLKRAEQANFLTVGMAWQTCRASGLVYGAPYDARAVVNKILVKERLEAVCKP